MGIDFIRHLIEHAVFLPLKGRYLLLQSLTTAQRNLLPVPNNFIIYNITTNQFEFYQAGAWVAYSLVGHTHDHNTLTNVTEWQHHPHGEWVLPPILSIISADTGLTPTGRAFFVPHIVKHRCRVDRLGILVGDQANNGNLQLGMYGPFTSWARVCVTAAIGVATLTTNKWNWFTPSTTPQIEPGLYWCAAVCDTSYSAGVAGMRLRYSDRVEYRDFLDTEVFGYQVSQRQDGAYPLPDPAVPVNWSNYRWHGINARCTVV